MKGDRVTAIAGMLGQLAAEDDYDMLSKAFYESQDYKTMLEGADTPVVVGRRGAGKTALIHQFADYWKQSQRSIVKIIAPDEDQVIALRPLLSQVAQAERMMQVAARIVWRYVLLMELGTALINDYKVKGTGVGDALATFTKHWKDTNRDFMQKLRAVISRVASQGETSEKRIGDLTTTLQIASLEKCVKDAVNLASIASVLLVDNLDAGFVPDTPGLAFVSGIIHGTVEFNKRFDKTSAFVFVRDNIFRGFERSDPDFTRDIEGRVLRLHWDENELFYLVCKRLRIAFDLQQESDTKVWAACTAKGLQGKDGFRKCLRLTLYRPRDIIALLNRAFQNAGKTNRREIILDDVEITAKEISELRLNDLKKEYSAIMPSLGAVVSGFATGAPELSVPEAKAVAEHVMELDTAAPEVREDITIYGTAANLLNALYGIGFIGAYDRAQGQFSFSHDGRRERDCCDESDRLLIHPCYWLALNLTTSHIDQAEAEDIFDEHDIAVQSKTPELRNKILGKLMEDLQAIRVGDEDYAKFEKWCREAIRKAFASSLNNVALKPNSSGSQRRDIIATNIATEDVWKWIRAQYTTRQVVFEIKNYDELTPDDFRQMWGYLCGEYGTCGFFVTRSETQEPTSTEMNWIREGYDKQKKLCVKLTAKWLCRCLLKLRSPQKRHFAADYLQKLLDQYARLYLQGQGVSAPGRSPRGHRRHKSRSD